jgi:hypothetical protein
MPSAAVCRAAYDQAVRETPHADLFSKMNRAIAEHILRDADQGLSQAAELRANAARPLPPKQNKAGGTLGAALPLMCMSTDQESEKKIRAEAHFKAREILRADADQARQDYQTAQAAILNRTERLRKERLAREARQSHAPQRASAKA